MAKKRRKRINYRHMFAGPFFVFMLAMVVFPLILLFYHAFQGPNGFGFENFSNIWNDGFSRPALRNSIFISILATTICLLIAFPIAYGLTMAGFKRGRTILLLFTLPMWTNLLLRSIALRQVLSLAGIGQGLGALLISMVFNFLPLMILPIYVVMGNIDKKYLEASQDLGANPATTFWKTVVPLSVPGILAGVILVFAPTMSTYFLSHYFGGPSITMIGEPLSSFVVLGDLGRGSVISIALLFIVFISVIILNKLSKTSNKKGGLW